MAGPPSEKDEGRGRAAGVAAAAAAAGGGWLIFLGQRIIKPARERRQGDGDIERGRENDQERERENGTDSLRPRPIPGLRQRTPPESAGEPTREGAFSKESSGWRYYLPPRGRAYSRGVTRRRP